jgi:hypothetical protein
MGHYVTASPYGGRRHQTHDGALCGGVRWRDPSPAAVEAAYLSAYLVARYAL